MSVATWELCEAQQHGEWEAELVAQSVVALINE